MSTMQAQVVSEATMEAMEAKQKFEAEQIRRNVRLLSEEIEDRLSALILRAEQVRARVSRASEGHGSVGYAQGAFGSDTDTIDRLLVALAEGSDHLENHLMATATGIELRDKFTAKLGAMQSEQDALQPEQGGTVYPMPAPGQYL